MAGVKTLSANTGLPAGFSAGSTGYEGEHEPSRLGSPAWPGEEQGTEGKDREHGLLAIPSAAPSPPEPLLTVSGLSESL